MGIFRRPFNGFQRSPSREIYGDKNGLLIAPIDICIYEFSDDSTVNLNQVSVANELIGADVRNTAGAKIGTIQDFDLPAGSGDIKPVVSIQPEKNVETVIAPRSAANPSAVNVGDDISAIIDGIQISGNVEETIASRAYLRPDWRIKAYRVKFTQRLLDRAHGAKVILNSSNQLLGMLIITEDNTFEGTTKAFVYPAHLI